MTFTGFQPAGLALLARLPGLDQAGFAAEHANWEQLLLQPARQFVDDLGARLVRQISPGLIGQAKVNGSISPINRDLRFDPHGARYKDHLLFRWWEGSPKKTAPTLFVRLDPERIGFASGVVFASTDRWRAVVSDDARARELHRILNRITSVTRGVELAGADLKRVPTPFTSDHPGADLLRHKATLQLRWSEPLSADAPKADLVDVAAERLQRLAALHRWLVAELGA
jgi:uncharacterized protein (DUF2461 family)